MIQTGFEKRVTVQQVIENQLPEFILSESPKTIDFLKQYYLSQEHQGGPLDIAVNLDQYLKVDNLTPEVISGETTLYSDVATSDTTVHVYSTKGFPNEYGLFKINNEVFTYTGLTTNTFTGVVRGFSGITSYRTDLDAEELLFNDTTAESHTATAKVQNLSALFLKEFYRKLKVTLTPGLEDVDFQTDLDVNNFIKEARSLYESKGTKESFRILFNALYGVAPNVVDLEQYLPKPSSSEFLRRELLVAERISGNPAKLVGQTIRKSSDAATQGAVSEVEVFTRSGISTYYKIGLFVGYSDNALIEGTFKVQPKTKVINPAATNDAIITVDSTIGFGATGTLISGDNVITYTDKTVNQFLGCDGVTVGIGTAAEIRTDEVFVGYEDGDLTKKVEIRLGGVLSDFETTSDVLDTSEEQVLYVKHVGEKILNPETNSTNKEIFANSWIYNTSNRFDIDEINTGSSTITLKTDNLDRSQLKVGDKVDILLFNSQNLAWTGATIANINNSLSQVQLNGLSGFAYDSTQTYTLRRVLETATSSGSPIHYGNNKVTSDITNVYNDKNEFFYVASNSLPSYDITKSTIKYTISTGTVGSLSGYDNVTETYQIISFSEPSLDFVTGDRIYYKADDGTTLKGLEEGYYFVKVISGGAIKIYESRALIETDGITIDGDIVNNALGFLTNGTNNHSFILANQVSDTIHPQRLLKKFPHVQDIKTGKDTKTVPGSVGMLVNGVEVVSYKSLDKIYYGPLEKITVYNTGKDYDVIDPPNITVAAGLGTTALVRSVVSGSVKEVLVDPQDFDVVDVKSVTISGGNGTGAVLEPMVGVRQRSVTFDSRNTVAGGGVSLDTTQRSIVFQQEHNFINGESLVYLNNGNTSLGIGTTGFAHDSIYYPEVINNTTARFYPSLSALNTGLIAAAVEPTDNGQGYHKFKKAEYTNTLRAIKVLDGGSGYTNRKLSVKPVGVHTISNTINFDGHGFNDGDLVNYTTDGTVIAGLSTANQYTIIKEDDDSFKLANAGVGGTLTTNYERRYYETFSDSGVGYQNFAYPEITLTVNATIAGVGTATQSVGVITATPIIRGEMVSAYLYEKGTGYGSSIINFNKSPIVTIKTGKNAEFLPIIVNGKIDQVKVTYSGLEYTSAPDLTFVGIGSGIGAKARAIVENGKVTDVVVINPGTGYDSNTGIAVTSIGLNAYIEADIRELSVNQHSRFGDEILVENTDGLEYGYVGHSTAIGSVSLGDKLDKHSPIIGWAYDGNPIYGPNGYSDVEDSNSSIKYINTGYRLAPTDVVDRPPAKIDGNPFAQGFFIEDYKFDNSGDLDVHNGRYGKTPEFPNGTYAYFAGIATATRAAKFPYYIGDSYRSNVVDQLVDQSFDFNTSDLVRNTLPYKAEDLNAGNDFISEPYETLQQRTIVDSISKGSVDAFVVNQAGDGYAVDDIVVFDNDGTNGGGLNAYVSEVKGKEISRIDTEVQTYADIQTTLVWDTSSQVSVHISPTHALNNGDTVVISGVSTHIKGLSKSHIIGVSSLSSSLVSDVPANPAVGDVDDIYVSTIPTNVSVGSTVAIGVTDQEIVEVLNIFDTENVLRVHRGQTGSVHTTSSPVEKISDSFTIPIVTDYFSSTLNDKVYFNPLQAVGMGVTTGGDATRSYTIGDTQESISIPYQSIYVPNHPFKQNQEVTFSRGTGAVIGVSKGPATGVINLPSSGTTQTMYVINKGKDFIGLTTAVGFNTNGFYFRSFGSNETGNGDARDWKYSLETNLTQQIAKIEKITSTVSVSTAHQLSNGDPIRLSLRSNQSVGIGTSTAVRLKYNSDNDKLIINPTTFTGSSIIAGNEFSITAHEFKTGDKVFYNGTATGLSTGSYYVYRLDDDKFQLGQTNKDVTTNPPTVLSITAGSGGSGQELSKVNPRIEAIRNNHLVFDTSDSTLVDYTVRIYHDEDFKNELVSVGGTITDFTIDRGITPSGSAGAAVTVGYSETLPSKLYYTIEKGGYISTSDTEVSNNSEILFTPSVYNNSYSVAGVGTTTFQVSLKSIPESLTYNQTTSSQLVYSTSSENARGGVESLRVTSGGLNYKKLPKFKSITSIDGANADIIPHSSTIGRIKEVTIQDPGFDYSADATLRPEVFISPNITVVDRNYVISVDVTSGGSGYSYAPELVVIDPGTGLPFDEGKLEAELQGSSISKVNVLQSPRGLADTINKVYAVNNTNGVSVEKIESTGIGTAIFTLVTPISNFSTAPFAVGDKIFIEGIDTLGIGNTVGSGYNSPDNSYKFFTVSAYDNANPVKVTVDLSEVTAYAGVAVTAVNGYGILVNQNTYPTFKVNQEPLDFILDEQVAVLKGGIYVLQDLYISLSLNDQIKVRGTYDLVNGDQIRGRFSGTIALIKTLVGNSARFKVDYSLRQDKGWTDDIGKLNEDYQVLPDNDYYQNLSYTVKSPIMWEDLQNPVNRLLHTTGLRNFADAGITTATSIKSGTPADSGSVALIDIINEKRVDTVSNFDFGIDLDATTNKSRYIKFQTKRLSDYIDCTSNRVLSIDDIGPFFNKTFPAPNLFTNLDTITSGAGYNRYLVQATNIGNDERSVTEVITLTNKTGDIFTFEKASVGIASTASNNSYKVTKLADIIGNSETEKLVFDPVNPYDNDYDIKIIKNTFNTKIAGTGSTSLGIVDITGSNTNVGVGTEVTLFSATANQNDGFFANVEVINDLTDEITYVEMYVDQDGTNTYISDFYFDNDQGVNGNFIGTFGASISGGLVNINFTNSTEINDVLVRSRVVGFGLTTAGIGTYRFLTSGQQPGTEKTARYESKYVYTDEPPVGVTTIFRTPKADVTSFKSIIKVGYGNTSALHQLLAVHNGGDSYITQFPYQSLGGTSGIGTFGTGYKGSDIELYFYPDSGINSQILTKSYTELIQTEKDIQNTPSDHLYGTISENIITTQFDATNGGRVNRTQFGLNYNGTPIFTKTFNPADTTQVTLGSGTFSLKNHFFQTGEQLVYTAADTFGTTPDAMEMSNSSNLPATVYAIKVTDDEFRVSATSGGAAITFNNAGAGNAHTLTMAKRAEKTVLSLDGIVQNPVTYTPVSYTLTDNFGSISATDTFASLSGISSILPGDILKIGNEFAKVATVGLGTTAVGPITETGTHNLVELERGYVGTTAAAHNDAAVARIYLGSYNIVDSDIHFTEAPTGNNITSIDPDTLLNTARSTFGGRVYLRQDYTKNQIYDNISKSFTGIGATYQLTVAGAGNSSTEQGSGIVLINNMFQTPTTTNNLGNTWSLTNNGVGSTITFSGITDDNGDLVISDYDVNKNQLPRGGMIVSLGSSLGSGYAPPVGAKDIDVVINGSGALTKVGIGSTTQHGSGYRGVVNVQVIDEVYEHRWVTAANNAVNGNLTPTDGTYDSSTGLLALTIPGHGLGASGNVTFANNSISMTCARDNHASTKTYPRAGIDPAGGGANRAYTRVDSDNISVNIGQAGGGANAVVAATVGAGGTLAFSVSTAGSGYKSPRILAPSPSYESLGIVGVSRLGIGMTTDTGTGLLLDLNVGPASAIPQNNKYGDASDLIDANNAFLSELAAKRMYDRWNNGSNSSYSYPGGFTEQDCIDDVVDVLEATSHNLKYGGNDKTYDAANLFVTGVYSNPAPVAGEEEQVIYALHEARDMATRALRNQTIYTHLGAQYAHTYSSGTVTNAVCSGGNYAHTYVAADSSANAINGSLKPTAAVYDAVAGTLALTFGSAHGIANGANVTIANHSLVFTCARDGHMTKHAYPRTSDPASGTNLSATVTSTTALTVTVGTSPLVFKSVVAGAGAEATSYDAKTGDLVLNVGSNHGLLAPTTLTAPSTAAYAPSTGNLTLTINAHGLSNGDYVKLDDGFVTFTCARDNHTTQHSYPLSRSSVSDTWLPVTNVTTNTFKVNVGKSPDTSAHTFVSATAGVKKANAGIGIGTSKLGFKCTRDANAANPQGVAQQLYPRPGDPFSWNKKQISIASTSTSSVTVNVGVSSTSHTNLQQTFDNTITVDSADPKCATVASSVNTLVGIVTGVIKTHSASQLPTRTISSFETYQVNDFKISRSGYGFKKGDVFEPVGLVTDAALTTPSKDFSLTVLETFTDNFAAWTFGELDYIDSIKDLQNGKRVRFPLQYNGDLLSFETSNSEIDLNSVLIIFVDGVLQHPGKHYTFDGGTSFVFSAPPEADSSISVFFYRGTRGVDSAYVNINESVKVGDIIQLKTTGAIKGQDERTISGISSSDKVQTNLYTGLNINEVDYRLLDWSKQKVDKNIEGENIYKSRDSIEGLVYPTARIIGDLPSSGISSIYVDDAHFFNYEENESSISIISCGGLIMQNTDPVAAAVTATVSAAGTISALTIVDGGSGYIGSAVTVSIARPVGSAVTFIGGVGVYTGIATATIPVVNGSLSGTANITSIGVGYTHSTSPNVLAPIEVVPLDETINTINVVKGFSGIITGISTSHNGSECYIEFNINKGDSGQNITNHLKPGYPIYVTGTHVGHGVTSIDRFEEASIISIGTTFIDNVYVVKHYNRFDDNTGIITCRIKTGSNVAGIATSITLNSTVAGINTDGYDLGRFSWGVLEYTDTRTTGVGIAVTGNILASGISTFPTIQRRGFGIRSNGALRKDLG